MYLQNSFYSNIDLYLNYLNKYLKNNYILKADYKTYDKEKDDNITFIIFDIISILQNEENKFIINQFNYEGNFTFIYNKTLNQVVIKEIPTINYNNKIKLPIFTQDLANILVDKLSNYIEKDKINITFKNILEIMAIDDTVKNIIPSIQDTNNYKLLNIILETISKEIKKIKQDIINQKNHYDKLERNKEKAINKKRVILGINPQNYDTEEKFYHALDSRIKSSFIKKHDKAKRHLELSEKKYKKLLDNDRLYYYFRYVILEAYLADDNFSIDDDKQKEIPIEFKEIIENTRLEFKKYLKKYANYQNNKINFSHIQYYLDDWITESHYFEKHKNDFITSLYNFDLHTTLNLIKKLTYSGRYMKELRMTDAKDYNSIQYKTLDSDEWIKWFCMEIFNIDDSLLPNSEYSDVKSLLRYHPIFYDEAIKKELDFTRKDYHLDIVKPFYKSKNFVTGFNLLQQIPKLIEIEQKYNTALKNIDNTVLDFKTFSASWGNIINLPYWCILDESKHETSRDGNYHDQFGYFVVKPGTQNIDFSKIRVFKRNMHKKLEDGYYESNPFNYNNINRFMFFIPKSLSFTDTKNILNQITCNSYDEYELKENSKLSSIEDCYCSKWLNIVCEDFELYMFVKKYLLNKLTKEDNLPTRIFVNYDPEYYKNYLIEAPIGEILWHKYDYINSDYKYKRKYLLDLRGQYNYANEYMNNILNISKNNNEYHDILNEILLGSYSSSPKSKKYINEFQEFLLIKEISFLSENRNYTTNDLEKIYNSISKNNYKENIRFKTLAEYQKRRIECSKITGISPHIEGKNDCIKILEKKYNQ